MSGWEWIRNSCSWLCSQYLYARISNKEAVREISRLIGRHPDGEKFPAEWNDADGILVIDLKKTEESV